MINSKEHIHTYNELGQRTCCSLEEKVNHVSEKTLKKNGNSSKFSLNDIKGYTNVAISLILLSLAIVFDNYIEQNWFNGSLRFLWYFVAYLPVGIPVIIDAVKAILKKDIFSEFFLMSLSTIGAFLIQEYPEGVAVMLFYSIGELLQSEAVKRAKGNIRDLLDIRPNSARVFRNEKFLSVNPESVKIGEIIQVMSGEKIPLDGILLSELSTLNTAALTGESKPLTIHKGEKILAGMINVGAVIELKTTNLFAESSISRILEMVQNASSRKAQTELFVRKFARIYTPVVVFLALCLTIIPSFFVDDYVFSDWLYRALIFLVISCPCALVISIPLGYFGGIGAASRNGILFKGSNFLDSMTEVDHVVVDKTGTLTKGVFKVQEIKSETLQESEFIGLVASLESKSTHPIAKAIVEYSAKNYRDHTISDVEEIPGFGMKGVYSNETILAGNTKLLEKFNIKYPKQINSIVDSIVVVSLNNKYLGYITIADEIKDDAQEAIDKLHSLNIRVIMLSGDKQAVVNKIANTLGIKGAYGDLLPNEKVEKLEELKSKTGKKIAFAGDGINDAPALALSDIGIAMGGLGSDAAIETADVVIQADLPSKISTAIHIGKATKRVVLQNIVLAFVVKAFVIVLGAGGIATMWEAVFADVGVALLAIMNAVRIQRMKFG